MPARPTGDAGLIGKIVLGLVLLAGAGGAGVAVLVLRHIKAHAVTRADFDHVKRGLSRDAVEARIGAPPGDLQHLVRKPAAGTGMTCTFYLQKDASGTNRKVYRFCYVRDHLVLKDVHDYRSVIRE